MLHFQFYWSNWANFKYTKSRVFIVDTWGNYYENYICFNVLQWRWWDDKYEETI
jgi:hypothetical protein